MRGIIEQAGERDRKRETLGFTETSLYYRIGTGFAVTSLGQLIFRVKKIGLRVNCRVTCARQPVYEVQERLIMANYS